MRGEVDNDWMDRSVRAVISRLADFFGLIGRNWLSVLGWSLFTMAISEPAHAIGQDGCSGFASVKDSCETWIQANPSQCTGFYACECTMSSSVSGGAQWYTVTTRQLRASDGALWSIPHSQSASCPLCSTQGTYTPPSGQTGWTGGPTDPVCISGCSYVPSPGAYASVEVGLVGAAGGDAAGTSLSVFTIQPTGAGCPNPGEPEAESVEDLPEVPEVCTQIQTTQGDSAVCISADADCDGYVGEFMGQRICVPKIQTTPCTGPYCETSDPPGDGDNDEENTDTPEMQINVVYPHDQNQNSTDDTDFFIPQADFPGGCNPCPYGGDPDDPRDPEGPPPPDTDGDGTPDATDPDIDGDGKPNGEDDDTDGDGIPNGDDDDIDNDGVPNGDDDDDDGDGQGGSGSDGNGVDPDDNADGTPDGVPEGDPDGECDPQTGQGCGEGEASGGARCDAPPVCTGDPVTCMVAYQAWETRCAVTDLEDRIFDTEGMDDSTGTEDVQPPDIQPFDTGSISFDDSGWLGGGGSCPDWTVSVMGTSYNLDESGHLCRFLQIGAGLVLVFAAWASARIIAGGVA